jgi:hypothetical protein
MRGRGKGKGKGRRQRAEGRRRKDKKGYIVIRLLIYRSAAPHGSPSTHLPIHPSTHPPIHPSIAVPSELGPIERLKQPLNHPFPSASCPLPSAFVHTLNLAIVLAQVESSDRPTPQKIRHWPPIAWGTCWLL